jgi:hypothetical protein
MAQLQKGIRAIMNYRWFVPAKIIAYVFLAVGLFGLITNNGLIAYGGAAIGAYIKAEVESLERTKDMQQKIDVYERYIEKYHIDTKGKS